MRKLDTLISDKLLDQVPIDVYIKEHDTLFGKFQQDWSRVAIDPKHRLWLYAKSLTKEFDGIDKIVFGCCTMGFTEIKRVEPTTHKISYTELQKHTEKIGWMVKNDMKYGMPDWCGELFFRGDDMKALSHVDVSGFSFFRGGRTEVLSHEDVSGFPGGRDELFSRRDDMKTLSYEDVSGFHPVKRNLQAKNLPWKDLEYLKEQIDICIKELEKEKNN